MQVFTHDDKTAESKNNLCVSIQTIIILCALNAHQSTSVLRINQCMLLGVYESLLLVALVGRLSLHFNLIFPSLPVGWENSC